MEALKYLQMGWKFFSLPFLFSHVLLCARLSQKQIKENEPWNVMKCKRKIQIAWLLLHDIVYVLSTYFYWNHGCVFFSRSSAERVRWGDPLWPSAGRQQRDFDLQRFCQPCCNYLHLVVQQWRLQLQHRAAGGLRAGAEHFPRWVDPHWDVHLPGPEPRGPEPFSWAAAGGGRNG